MKDISKEKMNWAQGGRAQDCSGVCAVSKENGTSDRDGHLAATKLAEGGTSLRESFPTQSRVPGDTPTQQVPKVHIRL